MQKITFAVLLALTISASASYATNNGEPAIGKSKTPKATNTVVILGDRVPLGSTTDANGNCTDVVKCNPSSAVCFEITPCPPCPSGPILASMYPSMPNDLILSENGDFTLTPGDGSPTKKAKALQFSMMDESLVITFWNFNPLAK